MRKVTAG
ncbi:hypothetical protein YPPY15_4573, partial [Yersinia pestis PY-15]